MGGKEKEKQVTVSVTLVELWAITPVGCNCLEQMDGKIIFDTCNADAIVCDAIIQYALFGTVVFG